jgi:hypothetical protein
MYQSTLDNDIEIDILEHIQSSEVEVRQRDLAQIISKSLGMTNVILKRLAAKGMLVVSKVNNRNISYAVTPDGLREIAKRSYRYVKRTIRNVVFFKEALDLHLRKYRQSCQSDQAMVVLVGHSEIDFIIEHLSTLHDLPFERVVDWSALRQSRAVGGLIFLSEDWSVGAIEQVCRSTNDIEFGFLISIASLLEASIHA